MNPRTRVSLNGQWSYVLDQYRFGEKGRYFRDPGRYKVGPDVQPRNHDADGVGTMPVPGCWNMVSPELHYFEQTVWYYRRFKRPAPAKGGRAFLRFEGSYYQTKVWLNGELLGEHLGGFTPFEFEITDALRAGENFLAVMVNASRDAERAPTTVTDWFTYGGLHRDVFIELRPRRFVTDFFVRLDARGRRILADVSATHAGRAVVAIPGLGVEQSVRIPGPGRPGKLAVPAPASLKRWSPDNPKRYKVLVRYGDDERAEQVGFRTIAARGGEFLLNGEPIRLKGICVHEDHVTRGRSLTDADRRDIVREAKALGCNFLRLAHYPHSAAMAELADREGLLLWEEVPLYWKIQWQNKGTFADAAGQLTELIVRDRNRAAVILWSVANETRPSAPGRNEFLSKLARLAKRLDPSRLTTAALFHADDGKTLHVDDPLAEALDVIGINQYGGWYGRGDSGIEQMGRFDNWKYPAKPVIVSEFGAGARAGVRGRFKFAEDYQRGVYRKQLAAMKKAKGVRGLTPWILFDFRSPMRVNRLQAGFNRKGLVAEDRRTRKLAFEVYRRFKW